MTRLPDPHYVEVARVFKFVLPIDDLAVENNHDLVVWWYDHKLVFLLRDDLNLVDDATDLLKRDSLEEGEHGEELGEEF